MRRYLAATAALLTAASLAACTSADDEEMSPAESTRAHQADQIAKVDEIRALYWDHPCDFTRERVAPLYAELDSIGLGFADSSPGQIDKAVKNAAEVFCKETADAIRSSSYATESEENTPTPTPPNPVVTQEPQPTPFDADAEAPAPPADVTLGTGKRWNLMGPFASLNTCDQNAALQPIQTSQCFTLSDGNAYFWNVVQG